MVANVEEDDNDGVDDNIDVEAPSPACGGVKDHGSNNDGTEGRHWECGHEDAGNSEPTIFIWDQLTNDHSEGQLHTSSDAEQGTPHDEHRDGTSGACNNWIRQ